MIGLIDYGLGNLEAFSKILKESNIPFKICSTEKCLEDCAKYILPGVGAFDDAVHKIRSLSCYERLVNEIKVIKKPILGICIGMHAFGKSSEEGNDIGLGILNFSVKKFSDSSIKIPHMGWNSISCQSKDLIMDGLNAEEGFYFLHSYYVEGIPKENILTTSFYGKTFVSGFVFDNIYGFQFHPEKSHKNGEQLILNFANL